MQPVKRLADGLYLLRGFPPAAINVYLMGDVIVDAATRHAGRRILRQVRGQRVTAHALTHAHPDHQGASKEICEKLGIPLWCGRGDADAMEGGYFEQARHRINRIIEWAWAGPGHPVARRLDEGDEIAGFRVLHVPGHSRGHVAYWRESDRVLVLGDVLNNMDVATGIRGLREPKRVFTPDPARNRESARRLAALEPGLVCFGHGPPLRDTRKFVDFVAALPN
jgi:glyoxylase-like metal-dependent hydrolase (beta-lactamase superfamily II)